MRSSAVAVLSLFLACVSPASAADSGFQIPETEIVLALQKAVRDDDRAWFVSHLHFPLRYYGKTNRIIRSKDWFLRHYARVIGPELKAAVLAQDPENYLKNYQGLMVGEGSRNIWFGDFGRDGVKYEIITINNSNPEH